MEIRRARTGLWGRLGAAAVSLTMLSALAVAPAQTAEAADPSGFNPGMIISDAVFFNAASMSANDVQLFLNARVSACSPGYVCMKDYSQDTPVIGGDRYCSGLNGGRDSAAQIVWEVAQSCGISPRVLLVLLEKEQSLVTMPNPSPGRFTYATGFSCPDTAPCDPAYSGFVYQVYYAARQFKVYGANPTYFGYAAGRTHQILYNPNESCGRKSVYIENQATANLYIYTPYTPNSAALNNLYGYGDDCSSYGNRNFWRLFTDWFGSTVSNTSINEAKSLTYSLYADVLNRQPDPGGLATWPGYLLYGGWTPGAVANAILSSEEYYTGRINDAYRTVLGREPDPNGAADWLNRMKTGRASVDEIYASFTKSAEYYARAGGTDTQFVRTLYLTMLGREAGDGEVNQWTALAAQRGTAAVVDAIYGSYESGVIRVTRVYVQYLKRGADPTGLQSWVPLVQAQGDQAVRSVVVGSREYYTMAQTRYPQP